MLVVTSCIGEKELSGQVDAEHKEICGIFDMIPYDFPLYSKYFFTAVVYRIYYLESLNVKVFG